jgi:hypothetical protein
MNTTNDDLTILTKTGSASLAEVLSYRNVDVVHRIARKLQMSLPLAEALFRDTLRFLYLAGATDAKHLAPTKKIDAGWHAFLMFTRDYQRFCQNYFARFVHHEPRRLTDAPPTFNHLAATFDVARKVFGPTLSENWTQQVRAADCETFSCTSRCSPDTGGGGDECTPDSGD